MGKMLKRFTKKFQYGEKGFTLVELLIVIAIIGVLAAVIIPNISKFTKSGSIAAAKAELRECQVAVDGMMADAGASAIPAFANWHGATGLVQCAAGGGAGATFDAGQYIQRAPTKGTYSVATDGVVTCTAYPGLAAGDLPS